MKRRESVICLLGVVKMININELKGFNLKKDINLKRVIKRWHNKNKSGGNFGINLMTGGPKDYELTGYHTINGDIYSLGLGELYQVNTRIIDRDNYKDWDYEKLVNLVKKVIHDHIEGVV